MRSPFPFREFIFDERGFAAEFALVLPLLLLFILGTIDVGIYAWRINQGEKATQIGARFAAVTDPIAESLTNATYVNANVGGTLITQGDRIPASALGLLTCNNSSCSCTIAPCPGTSFRSTAFANLSTRMKQIMPTILDSNIVVEYSGSGLGFAGDPNGPEIAPVITVKLTNMTHTPIAFSPLGAGVDLPDFSYSITAEDARGTTSN